MSRQETGGKEEGSGRACGKCITGNQVEAGKIFCEGVPLLGEKASATLIGWRSRLCSMGGLLPPPHFAKILILLDLWDDSGCRILILENLGL